MVLMDSLARAFSAIYSYSDEITEDYIDKQYFGLVRLSGVFLKMDGYSAASVFSLIQLAVYISVSIFHYIVEMITCFKLIHINFVLFSQSTHFCLLMQLVAVLIFYLQFKRKEILNLHKALNTNFYDYHEHYKGPVDELRREMLRERKILFTLPIATGLATILVLGVAPFADQYGTFDVNRTTGKVAVNYKLPIPYGAYPYSTEEPFAYCITLVLQLFEGFILSSTIGTLGIIFIISSQNISLQMKILLDSLANIEERTIIMLAARFSLKLTLKSEKKLYSTKEFAYCYNMCLRKSLEHHQVIRRHFHEWKSIYSIPTFVAYMTGTIVIALSLLSASSWSELPGTTVSSIVLCGGEVGYMLLISALSQRITDLNEDLRFQMYSIKWYHCDEGVKRSLRIFQEVTKRPMTMVSGGIIPANMDTFAKVMNSAYSYYTLAKAFKVT